MPCIDKTQGRVAGIEDSAIPMLLNSVTKTLDVERQSWSLRELNEAGRFRSFSFFSKREEAVSRVIAALLNPQGLHGQGATFLNLFIAQVESKRLAEKTLNLGVRSVCVEDPTAQRRRIDIVVSFDKGFNLGIESKVFDAEEQENQLKAYVTELEMRGDFILLFLHPDGAEGCESLPQEEQENLIREGKLVQLPAKEFLLAWLQKCSQKDVCRASRVREFLNEFSYYLQHPPEETFMTSKKLETSVVQHILQSEEALESALAIHRHLQAATDELLDSFLNGLQVKLNARLISMAKAAPAWAMHKSSVLWEKDARPALAKQLGPFTGGFRHNEWKYVGFSVEPSVSISLEMGFKVAPRNPRVKLDATIGIRKAGPYQKKGKVWVTTSKLEDRQEAQLRMEIDKLKHPAFTLFSPELDVYEDWHWHRYLSDAFLPRRGEDYTKFFSVVHDQSDRSLEDLADLMIQLGKEVSRM